MVLFYIIPEGDKELILFWDINVHVAVGVGEYTGGRPLLPIADNDEIDWYAVSFHNITSCMT